MKQTIVFLERNTFNVPFRKPSFDHEWIEFGETTPEQVVARLAGATIAICNKVQLRGQALSQLPKLRLIAVAATGVDNVDLVHCRSHNIAVCNTRGYAVNSLPEHALMLMLVCVKKTLYQDKLTRAGDWGAKRGSASTAHTELEGKTLGIVGIGNIGRRVAKFCGAIGMKVLAYDKYVPADEVRNRGVEPMPDMGSVLRQADVVTCHTPHTKETHHMIDAAAVAQMKDGVIFVNTSRGKTQDESALVAGLESGKIRAAGIDVFEEEPASSDNRFFQLENVIVSPHVAGVTRETMRGMALQVTAEMLRVLPGERPHVLGNPELWPRLGHLK